MADYFSRKKEAFDVIDRIIDGTETIGIDIDRIIYAVENKTGMGRRFIMERLKLLESLGTITVTDYVVRKEHDKINI